MVGLFKDDRIQTHGHDVEVSLPATTPTAYGLVNCGSTGAYTRTNIHGLMNSCRSGNTTRGKRKGVKYIIKVL